MDMKTATIGGVHVELETWTEDGEPRSSCTLTKRLAGSEYSASLELAEDTGGLPYMAGPGCASLGTNAYGEEHYPLSEGALAAITDWAVDNGY